MKNLLLIIGLGMTLNCSAQYTQSYNPPKGWGEIEMYLPVTIIASTFALNNHLGYDVTYGTRTTIAITGAATSVLTHFIFRAIRERKSNKHKSHNNFLAIRTKSNNKHLFTHKYR